MTTAATPGEQAREHVELEQDRAGIDAGVAGRLLVRADHVNLCPERRRVQHERDGQGTEREHDQGKGYPENGSIADKNNGLRKSGDDIATCQADREALAERHRAERCEDRRNAEIGDDKSVDEADQCGNGKSCRDRQHLHADPGNAFAARNVARQ